MRMILGMLLATMTACAGETNSIYTRVFDVTNHEGQVFEAARILKLDSDFATVVCTKGIGGGKVYLTNLPPIIRAELAANAVAARLNRPDQARPEVRKSVYETVTAGMEGTTGLDRMRGLMEASKLVAKMMEDISRQMDKFEEEKLGRDLEQMKNLNRARKLAEGALDIEEAKIREDYRQDRINDVRQKELLLALKAKRFKVDDAFDAAEKKAVQGASTVAEVLREHYDECSATSKRLHAEFLAEEKKVQADFEKRRLIKKGQ